MKSGKTKIIKSYGFFPQMKAEGIAFKEEKSGAIVIGTNPGFQNGVLILFEQDNGQEKPTSGGHRGQT